MQIQVESSLLILKRIQRTTWLDHGKNARSASPGGVHHGQKALKLPLQLTGGIPPFSFTEEEVSSHLVRK